MESVEGVATVGRDNVGEMKGVSLDGQRWRTGGGRVGDMGRGGPGDGSKNGVGRRGSHKTMLRKRKGRPQIGSGEGLVVGGSEIWEGGSWGWK
jgi:hypothetical protein